LALDLGCGRLGFDPMSSDATDAADELGERISMPAGWTADVWLDFTPSFVYQPDLYSDPPFSFSNRPHRMFLLDAPFAPGIGLVSTWDIIEARAPDVFISHSYFQAVSTTEGPDALWDATLCGAYMAIGGAGGICVAAGSQDDGDGLFRIESDWRIQLVDPLNNVVDIAYDPTGVFDGVGVPAIYWSDPTSLKRHGGGSIHPGNHLGSSTEILPTTQILTVTGGPLGPMWTLSLVESVTHTANVLMETTTARVVARQNAGAFSIVTGDTSGLPGIGYVVVEARQLFRLDGTAVATKVAETDPDDDWMWTHAVVPPASHPLGDRPMFYLLEYNTRTEQNRIIRLIPP